MPATNVKEWSANLQAAVKAVNDIVGPNSLIPTFLMFGTLPRLALSIDSAIPIITQRAAVFRRAIKDL